MNFNEKIIQRKFLMKNKESSYEILFIAKKTDEEKINESVKNRIEEIKVKNLKFVIWKEMKTAYSFADVSQTENVIYYLVRFDCEKSEISNIEEILKTSEKIKRYRILNLTKDSKKMKVGKIRNPKPRLKRRPVFSREKKENSNSLNSIDSISEKKES